MWRRRRASLASSNARARLDSKRVAWSRLHESLASHALSNISACRTILRTPLLSTANIRNCTASHHYHQEALSSPSVECNAALPSAQRTHSNLQMINRTGLFCILAATALPHGARVARSTKARNAAPMGAVFQLHHRERRIQTDGAHVAVVLRTDDVQGSDVDGAVETKTLQALQVPRGQLGVVAHWQVAARHRFACVLTWHPRRLEVCTLAAVTTTAAVFAVISAQVGVIQARPVASARHDHDGVFSSTAVKRATCRFWRYRKQRSRNAAANARMSTTTAPSDPLHEVGEIGRKLCSQLLAKRVYLRRVPQTFQPRRPSRRLPTGWLLGHPGFLAAHPPSVSKRIGVPDVAMIYEARRIINHTTKRD